jgi:hypothetical protein
LQRERQQRQQLEQQFRSQQQQAQQWQAQLEERNRQIQALTGAKAPNASEAQDEEIKQRLFQLVPWMAKLNDEQIDRLLQLGESANTLQETTQHYWTSHGRSMLSDLHATVAEELGSDDLTPFQKKTLTDAYIREAERNPEFLQRHEQGDPTLLQEFAKEFLADWFETARRKVTSTAVSQQRRVPSGRGTQPVSTAPRKIDFNDPKAVEDAMVASFTDHGGTFGSHR